MGILGKLFGEKNPGAKPASRSLKEESLTAIDALNAQIAGLENDPNLSDAQKAEQIALLKREIKTFADAMGWKYDA